MIEKKTFPLLVFNNINSGNIFLGHPVYVFGICGVDSLQKACLSFHSIFYCDQNYDRVSLCNVIFHDYQTIKCFIVLHALRSQSMGIHLDSIVTLKYTRFLSNRMHKCSTSLTLSYLSIVYVVEFSLGHRTPLLTTFI